MRVTDSLRTNSLLRNIQTSLDNLDKVQTQISTGKQLNNLSDDPTAGSQALSLRASLVDNTQYQRNTDEAKSFLSATDSALSSAGDLMQTARSIAVQGANGTENQQSLDSLVTQVNGLIKQLTQVANSDLHGKYLFGGTRTQTTPFVAPTTGTDPTPAYAGDGGSVTATVGKNDSLSLNTPGSTTFNSAFAALQKLRDNLTAGNQTAVSASIDEVDASLTTVNSVRAAAGAKINEVDGIKQSLTRAQGDYEDAVSNLEDVDLAHAYVQLQSAQNVYQASLVTTSRAFQYSLAQYLG